MSDVSRKGSVVVVEFKPVSGSTETSTYGSRLEMILAALHDRSIGGGMYGGEDHIAALKAVIKEAESAIYNIEHRSIWD